MMTLENYCNTSNEVFNGHPWYGDSLMASLQNIPLENWNRKPENTSNSIANLVCHMIDWRCFVIEKLKENASFDIELNTSADWRENIRVHTEEEKNKIVSELKDSQEQLMALIKEKKATWLSNKTPGKEYTNEYMLQGVLQHDMYHLGQINLINNQLKNL